MPNYTIPEYIRTQILNGATKQLETRAAYAQANFPLAQEEVQSILLEDATTSTLRDLALRGVTALPRTNEAWMYFTMEATGLPRGVGVKIHTPRSMYYGTRQTAFCYSNTTEVNMDWMSKFNIYDPSRLSQDRHEALLAWIAHALRERRLQEMTRWVVKYLLQNKHVPTSGHLLVRAPALALFVTDKDWKSKLQNPPTRNQKLYQWEGNTAPAPFTKLLPAAMNVLTASTLLTDYTAPTDVPTATIEAWQKHEGEYNFPGAFQ